jgi:hypothetical protein
MTLSDLKELLPDGLKNVTYDQLTNNGIANKYPALTYRTHISNLQPKDTG